MKFRRQSNGKLVSGFENVFVNSVQRPFLQKEFDSLLILVSFKWYIPGLFFPEGVHLLGHLLNAGILTVEGNNCVFPLPCFHVCSHLAVFLENHLLIEFKTDRSENIMIYWTGGLRSWEYCFAIKSAVVFGVLTAWVKPRYRNGDQAVVILHLLCVGGWNSEDGCR